MWTDKMWKMPSFIRKNQIFWKVLQTRQRFRVEKPNSMYEMSGNGVRKYQNEEMKLLDGEVPKSHLEPEGKTTFFQRFVNTYRYKCSLLNWLLLLFCSKGKPVDVSWSFQEPSGRKTKCIKSKHHTCHLNFSPLMIHET